MPTILLLLGAVLCVGFYLYVYFAAESPKKGTLEWVTLYEKPQMSRDILHKLKWWDILWCALVFVCAAAAGIGLGGGVNLSMILTALAHDLLSAAMTAALTYLAAKLLTGSVHLSLLASLLLCCHTGSIEPLAPVMCSFLLLLYHVGTRGWKAWVSLIFSALSLAAATYYVPTLFLLALPWLGCILANEILRIKQDEVGPWHPLWTMLTFAVLLSAGAMAATTPFYLGMFSAAGVFPLWDGSYYAMFWMRLLGDLQLAGFYGIAIAALPLVLAGIVLLADSLRRRKDLAACILLLMALSALLLQPFVRAGAMIFPAASLCLAYLTNRIRVRKFPGAAVVVALVPILITLTGTILKLLEV